MDRPQMYICGLSPINVFLSVRPKNEEYRAVPIIKTVERLLGAFEIKI